MPARSSSRTADRSPWVVAVSMGFGHQRTAYPLRDLAAHRTIVNGNDYPSIPPQDRRRWEEGRRFYEAVSRAERIPVIGKFIFGIFDFFQKVATFYPKLPSPAPTFQLKHTFRLIRKGWGEHFIERLMKEERPLLTTFFTTAYMAEEHDYPGAIFCIVCDADISRTWAPDRPEESRIRYFAPTHRAADRLMRYGVPHDHITVTGYPLPKENLGTPTFGTAKKDLARRLVNLDPTRSYRSRYDALIRRYVGRLPNAAGHPLTILFSIGGAGAQQDIALSAAHALRHQIASGRVRLVVACGTNPALPHALRTALKDTSLGKRIVFLGGKTVPAYFEAFNAALHETDVLWTKPSELSFYAGLGIPLIIAPPLGSHEERNKEWLLELGAGIPQNDPQYADEWLFDAVREGRLAEAAMQGFIEIEKGGTFTIEKFFTK